MNTKHCPQCEQDLPRSDFYRDRTRYDGLQGRCKACTRANSRAYARNNREKVNAYRREYARNNRERLNNYKRAYRARLAKQAQPTQ